MNFLENANETFEGIELVLSSVGYKDDNKEKLEGLIEKIKVNVTVYDEKQIGCNVFKYMNLFYKD